MWDNETLVSRFYKILRVKPRSDAIVRHLQHYTELEGSSIGGIAGNRADNRPAF